MAAASFAAHMHPGTEPATAVRLRRTRVLVIDDEAALGRSIQRLLSKDHDVTVESDARRGAALAASGGWDVVFCDLMMPGMTGMDLYEGLVATRPDMARRVVFMTAGSFSPRSWEFLESTLNPRLTKPFEPSALRRAVVELLAKIAGEDGAPEMQTERA
jgi:DNA-binding response OmpR family regulator